MPTGGSNPALRTLYYRLLRLLSMAIQPLFVFDGPDKPPFKRNKRIHSTAPYLPNILTKQLLNHFGFPYHDAPGEAEAECALLQREGVVDAVLSEDVDTLMFGCGVTFRNWSSDGSKGRQSPTHVSVYEANATKKGKSGLDRDGMVLIALMSGGDYITEGIPGCGIKIACEAARAGFGKYLCELSQDDKAGFIAWRQKLVHELHTNESKHFRTKHGGLKVPKTFPNMDVLGYYTRPAISSASKLESIRDEITWDRKVDVSGLRCFVADVFGWSNRSGAKKFVRGLAPALLVANLLKNGNPSASGYNVILTQVNQMELVRTISGKRTHFSTDGTPEFRLVYHPLDVVPVKLEEEQDDCAVTGCNEPRPTADPYDLANDSDFPCQSQNLPRTCHSTYDPEKPGSIWVAETIVKIGLPLKVRDYEESLRRSLQRQKAKPATTKMATKGGMPKGALDRYILTSKPSSATSFKSTKGKASGISVSFTDFQAPFSIERGGLAATTAVNKSEKTSKSDDILTPKSSSSVQAVVSKTRKPTHANPWILSRGSPVPVDQLQILKDSSIKRTQKRDLVGMINETVIPTLSFASTTRRKQITQDSVLAGLSPQSENIGVNSAICDTAASHKEQPAGIYPRNSESRHYNEDAVRRECPHHLSNMLKPTFSLTSPPLTYLPSGRDTESCTFEQHSPGSNMALSSQQSTNYEEEAWKPIYSSPSSSNITIPEVNAPLLASNASVLEMGSPAIVGKRLKRLYKLRESLEGSLKEVQEESIEHTEHGPIAKPRRTWRLSEVEVLDLTGV